MYSLLKIYKNQIKLHFNKLCNKKGVKMYPELRFSYFFFHILQSHYTFCIRSWYNYAKWTCWFWQAQLWIPTYSLIKLNFPSVILFHMLLTMCIILKTIPKILNVYFSIFTILCTANYFSYKVQKLVYISFFFILIIHGGI